MLRRLLLVLLSLAAIAPAQDERPVLGRLSLRSPRPGAAPEGSGEWLRSGLPLLPRVEITSLEGLRLENAAGEPLVARLRVLTRRGGASDDLHAPIDWIEVTFAPRRGDGSEFVIRRGESPPGGLVIGEREGRVRIDSGELSLHLDPQSPALLTALRAGSRDLLSAPALRPLMRDEGGDVVEPGPWKIVVEAADAGAIDILASCRLGDLDFELRLQLLAGCDEIVIDQRLVNRGPYGHMATRSEHRYFRSLDLSLPVPAAAVALADRLGTIALPSSWALLQQHETPYEKGRPAETFPAQIWVDGELRSRMERAEGEVAVGASGLAIAYRVDDFWENAPGSLFLDQGELHWGLFPFGGSGPHFRGRYGRPPSEGEIDERSLKAYRFEGARAKSRRIVLGFGRESAGAVLARQGERSGRQLHAAPPPEDLAGRRILGYRLLPRGSVPGAAAVRFERFSDVLVSDAAADQQDALGRIGLPGFIERGGTYGNRVFRGWFNHGDIAWGSGYASLHYDLPFSMLFQYLRSGDARFFSIGEDMARHRRDIDQDHDTSSGFKLAGGQFYEKGYWHGNYYHPSISHTWLRGPLLHWLLSGDRWSLEAALLNRDFLRRAGLGDWNGDWGARIPGWGADQLLALWSALGDPADRDAAEAALAAYEKIESERDGGRGFVINRRMRTPSCKPWMIAILGCAAAQHGLLTGSDRFRPLASRVAGFLRDAALEDPTAEFPRVIRNWSPEGGDQAEHHLAWGPAAFFALRAELEDSTADRALARRLAASAVLRHAERSGAPVAFRMLAYPNSESKIHSGIQIWGLLALPAFDEN